MSSSTLKEIEALKKRKKRELEKGNIKEVAELCNVLGEALHSAGQLWDAIEQHEEERQYCDALGDPLGVAFAHRKIGECHFDLAEYSKALRHQKQHLSIAEKERSEVEQQRALATIGRTYFQSATDAGENDDVDRREQQQLLRKAEGAYLRSLEKCELLRGHIQDSEYQEMKVRLLLNIGLVFQEYDDETSHEKARKYVSKSYTMAKRYSLKEDLFRAAFNLADMYILTDLNQAAEYADTAVTMATQIRSKDMQKDAISTKAKVLMHKQKFRQAKHLWKKIYKLSSAKSDPEYHSMAKESAINAAKLEHSWTELSRMEGAARLPLLETCANLLIDFAAPTTAIKMYEEMLEHTDSPGPAYRCLGDACMSLRRYQDAAQHYTQEAECYFSQPKQAWKAYESVVECEQLLGTRTSAISAVYKQALNMAQATNNTKIQKAILKELINIEQESSNDADSEHSYQQQLAQLDKDSDLPENPSKENSEEDSQGSEDESQPNDDDSDSINISDISDSDSSDHEEEYDRGGGGGATARSTRRQMKVKRNEKGETPLHVACINGKLGRVRELLKLGHPINVTDFSQWLPLHEASNHGFEDIVTCLLDHGADPNCRGYNGLTPLMDACSCGHWNVVVLLLDKGADPMLKDKGGENALDYLVGYRTGNNDLDPSERRQIRQIERRLQGKTDDGEEELMEDSEIQIPHRARERIGGNFIEDEEEHDVVEEQDSEEASERYESNPYCADGPDTVLQNPHKAPHLYREVMQSLRSVTDAPRTRTSHRRKTASIDDSPAAALITSTTAADDDWIEDDMQIQPQSKRRRVDVDKYLYGNNAGGTQRKSRKESDNLNESRNQKQSQKNTKRTRTDSQTSGPSTSQDRIHSTNRTSDCYDSNDLPMNSDTENNENMSPSPNRSPYSSPIISPSQNTDHYNNRDNSIFGSSDKDNEDSSPDFVSLNRKSIVHRNKHKLKAKRQLKVTDFTETINNGEMVDSGTPSGLSISRLSGVSNSGVSTPPFRTSQENHCIPPLSVAPPVVGAVRRIRVNIQDKLIMVPVQPDTNVGVLGQEAAERYYKLCSVRPLHLSLRTKDGAQLMPDDRVADLLQNDEEVYGDVSSWELQPLSERYTKACADLNAGVYDDIKERLNEVSVSLSGLTLSSSDFHPLTRALHCHTSITELSLAGLGLRDADIEKLDICSLTGLRSLDLSANRLTHLTVQKLTSSSLQRINLSHNRLGELPFMTLCEFLERLGGLLCLRLSHCHLSSRTLQGSRQRLKQAMTGLTEVDVSYNKDLGVLGCELLLQCLSHDGIRTLDLSATVLTYSNDLLPNHLTTFASQPGCVLEKLSLNNCSITPHQVPRIASLISLCPSLQHLSLNNNRRLSLQSICHLLSTASPQSTLKSLHAMGGTISNAATSTMITSEHINIQTSDVFHQLTESLTELCIGPGLVGHEQDGLEQAWRERWGMDRACVSVAKGGVVKLTVKDVMG